jgi:hypothetical protein
MVSRTVAAWQKKGAEDQFANNRGFWPARREQNGGSTAGRPVEGERIEKLSNGLPGSEPANPKIFAIERQKFELMPK